MTSAERPWEGRVAFITGAVTGIGLGVAQAFADAGMRLALSYRNEDDRAHTAKWFADKGYEQPLFLRLDVTDRARFAEVADQVVQHFGEVHVLVNNAGVSVFGPTDEASYDDYDWIMGVNFGGNVNGLVSFLPKIKASTGRRHVVNIASMAAFLPGPPAGSYTASTSAVRGWTERPRNNPAPHGTSSPARRAAPPPATSPPGAPTAFPPHGRRERHRRRRPATRHDQREVAMNDQPLRGKKVAILATDGVEISEYVQPRAAVENAGAQVELISIKNGEIQGFHHLDKADRFPVDKLARDADPNDYDALLLPGGVANPDQLRMNEDA